MALTHLPAPSETRTDATWELMAPVTNTPKLEPAESSQNQLAYETWTAWPGASRKAHVMSPSSWTQRVPDGPGHAWITDARPRTQTWAIVRTAVGLLLPDGELMAGIPLGDGRAEGCPEGRAKANQTAARTRIAAPARTRRIACRRRGALDMSTDDHIDASPPAWVRSRRGIL